MATHKLWQKQKIFYVATLLSLIIAFTILFSSLVYLSQLPLDWFDILYFLFMNITILFYLIISNRNHSFSIKRVVSILALMLLLGEITDYVFKVWIRKETFIVTDLVNMLILELMYLPFLQFLLKEFRRMYNQNLLFEEHRERYRALFYQTSNGAYELDDNGRFIRLNNAFSTLSGYTDNEILGKFSLDLVFPEDQERAIKHFKIALAGESQTYQLRIRHRDGSIRQTVVTNVPMNLKGRISGIFGICNDITAQWQAEQALIESEKQYRRIYDNLEVGIWSFDSINNHILFCSRGIEKITGYSSQEYLSNNELFLSIVHKDDFDQIVENREKLIAGFMTNFEDQYRIINKNGQIHWVNDQVFPIKDAKGNVIQLDGILIDNTKDFLRTKALQESQERYRRLVEFLPVAFFVIKNNEILYTNEAGLELLGAPSVKDLQNKTTSSFLDKESLALLELCNENKGRDTSKHLELQIHRFTGEKRFVESTFTSIPYNGEEALYVVAHDITQRKQTEERNHFLAYHDDMTRLPNRRFMLQQLVRSIFNAKKNGEKVAILSMDLDRFKWVNDTFSRTIGDKLLLQIAEKLEDHLDSRAFLSRVAGDELVAILSDVDDITEVEEFAQFILHRLGDESFRIKDFDIHISISIGISLYPNHGTDVDTLLKRADEALYQVKKQGGNHFLLYKKEFSEVISTKGKVEHALRKALKNHEFVLHYQPQVDSKTQTITGVEALVRWDHPVWGLIPPSNFIPVAEETGLILPIGHWVLEEACRQNKQLEQLGIGPIEMSVNISMLQFQQNHFTQCIKEMVMDTKLNPKYLTIELTESVMMHDIEQSIRKLNELKELGIKIAIDDFGTGYSSLSYLKQLPIDTLKIAQQFVMDIQNSDDDKTIVKTIALLAQNLNLEVVAEGVETAEQYRLLSELQCQKIQGYYFSKPVPENELITLLKEKLLLPTL